MLLKRPTIALFISELEGDFSTSLWRGVNDGAIANDSNLLLLPGKTINSPYAYQYQYHVIYDLINHKNVDALILPSSLFSNYLPKGEFEKFYKSYLPIPIVSLSVPLPEASNIIVENRKGLDNLLSHLIEAHGRKRIAYIKGPEMNAEAEERFDVYCTVLKKYGIPYDPQLVCTGDYSDYSAVEAMRMLLDVRQTPFDAVAAANDQMALTALTILQKRGYKVPEDVTVVGFDNVEGAQLSIPPLSTVEQPIYEMGKKSVEMALALINGGAAETISIDTKMVIRKSCGCRSVSYTGRNESGKRLPTNQQLSVNSSELFLAEETKQMKGLVLPLSEIEDFIFRVIRESDSQTVADAYSAFYRIVNGGYLGEEEAFYIQSLITRLRNYKIRNASKTDLWEDFFDFARVVLMETFQRGNALRKKIQSSNVKSLRGVLNSMVANLSDRNSAVRAIGEYMERFGFKTCYIGLYDRDFTYLKGGQWVTPSTIEMTLVYRDGVIVGFDKQDGRIKTEDFLEQERLAQNNRYSLVLNPLFFLEDQLGLILCDFNPNDNYLYESLFMEMSCVLKLATLIEVKDRMEDKLRDALHILEDYNEQLSNLSQTDELTGLYNRRGFLNLSKQSLKIVRQMKKSGMLFYADLDGLKIINDTYGHEEGDCALRQTALILKKTFRNADIIARLGGDEFTVFTADTTPETAEAIQSRLARTIGDYNQCSGKPYQIAISMGSVPFNGYEDISIEKLMIKADTLLYEQKRQKPQRNSQSIH